MGRCHEQNQGGVSEDGVVWEAVAGDVKVDELGAVVFAGAEGHRKADLPQGAGGADADPRERLGGAERAVWYMKQAEGFYGEQVEAGTTVDEGLGDSYAADGGRAQHWEHARADGGGGVIPRVEGKVGLGRRPTRGSSLARGGGANLAKERLGVMV